MKTKPRLIRSLVVAGVLAGLGADMPILRAEDVSAPKGVKFPFTVYDEKGGTNNHYIASGWMGNAKGTKMDEGCTNNPHDGQTCLRVEYSEAGDWAGVVCQEPVNDWGDQPGGWNLSGARKLKFWVRGDKGGETVNFKFGILGTDRKYPDSATGETGSLTLTKAWTEHTIDLDGKDLTRIKTGFVWTLAGQGSPVVFLLDDIQFE